MAGAIFVADELTSAYGRGRASIQVVTQHTDDRALSMPSRCHRV
jgi:hypothetical protein